MEYRVLAIGLTDDLFSGLQSSLSSNNLCLTPSPTVRDANHLLESQIFHLLIVDLAYLRRYTEYNHYRMPGTAISAAFQVEDIFIDPARHIVRVLGQAVSLRPCEFSLLLFFLQNPNIVLTSEQICEHAWRMKEGYNRG